MKFIRFDHNPIITPDAATSLVEHGQRNVNGPCLVAAPDWLPGRLGRYYLYFSHHGGTHIRLAYADDLRGKWAVHEPGTLQLANTHFSNHIASPDVIVDHANRRLVMYYHGCCNTDPSIPWAQYTCAAVSSDGLHFVSQPEPLCQSYLRRFDWRGTHYGIAMPGQFYRSPDGLTDFEGLPATIADALCHPHHLDNDHKARHFAVQLRGDVLRLFFTRAGDCPEHVMMTDIALHDDWTKWQPGEIVSVVEPEMDWEGANWPPTTSRGGPVHEPSRHLRDPAIFEEDGRTYLLYAVAGEQGIAIGELVEG